MSMTLTTRLKGLRARRPDGLHQVIGAMAVLAQQVRDPQQGR
jgi:hypothetical protein